MENTDLPASIAQNPNIAPALALWAFGVFCGFIFRIIFEKLTKGKGEETLELSLMQTDADEDINSERRFINIEPGDRIIRIHYKLPEDLKQGSYVIRGNVHFRVEGIPRDAYFFTQEFLVATSSAKVQ